MGYSLTCLDFKPIFNWYQLSENKEQSQRSYVKISPISFALVRFSVRVYNLI